VEKLLRKKENRELISILVQKSIYYDNNPIKIGSELKDKSCDKDPQN
jgi:hypothetical protein